MLEKSLPNFRKMCSLEQNTNSTCSFCARRDQRALDMSGHPHDDARMAGFHLEVVVIAPVLRLLSIRCALIAFRFTPPSPRCVLRVWTSRRPLFLPQCLQCNQSPNWNPPTAFSRRPSITPLAHAQPPRSHARAPNLHQCRYMKLIKNTGNDRVMDALRSGLSATSKLDIATPAFSMFAFAEFAAQLQGLSACRLVLPDASQTDLQIGI